MESRRKIVFHIRPWEVNLYTELEKYLSRNTHIDLEFLYITHHFKAKYLLKKRRRECLNINRELRKIPIPSDWLEKLQQLEDRTNGKMRNFQQYLAAERFLKGKPRNYQMKQLYRMAMFFDTYFEKHKPFFMLSNGPDHMAFWLAMDLLRDHGGHPCGLVSTSWPKNRVILFRRVGQNYYSRELYTGFIERGLTEAERQEARWRQESLRNGKAIPVFIKGDRNKMSPNRTFWERLKSRSSSIYWQVAERFNGGWHIQPIPIPGRFVLGECWIKLKGAHFKRHVADSMDWSRPFVFFPLHLEPEATILVHSSPFDNQLEIIRLLSKALPVSWNLVVKDHPNMAGRRSWSFIREIKRLPNVILLRNDEPSWKLIQRAHLVAVLTGTAGLEACVLGKPVLGFGNPPWSYAPTFWSVGDVTNLHEELRKAAAMELPPDDERVQGFLLSWVQANPEGVHAYFPWFPPIDHPKNVALIGKGLVKLLHDLDKGKFPGA